MGRYDFAISCGASAIEVGIKRRRTLVACS
jgi:hypothetical protein